MSASGLPGMTPRVDRQSADKKVRAPANPPLPPQTRCIGLIHSSVLHTVPSMTTITGIDTGGTFTDVVSVGPDKTAHLSKIPSQPHAPEKPVLAIAESLPSRSDIRYGTTVATNAVLTRSLARTALVTNRGFRDLLSIGRQQRPALYDFHPRPIEPPLPPDLVLEFNIPPVSDSFRHTLAAENIAALRKRLPPDLESLAVCLLFSHLDDSVECALRASLPLTCPIVLSSEVLPVQNEYERAMTTVINAMLIPRIRPFFSKLARHLREIASPKRFSILASHGGVIRPKSAADFPVRTLLSGPAGGAAGAAAVSRHHQLTTALAFDMGGTSTDLCLIEKGRTSLRDALSVGGWFVGGTRVGVETIGAGGGSIIRNQDGTIRVGPESAGADPGPACYGRSGPPTVTDCHLLLGHIPRLRLPGGLTLSRELSENALAKVGHPLGLNPKETAAIALEVIEARMSRACRAVAVEAGYDPAEAVLIPFGGAGPLHSCTLADALGCRTVLIPQGAGVLSALGMLSAPPRSLARKSVLVSWNDAVRNPGILPWKSLERRVLSDLGPIPETTFRKTAFCRYRGQSSTIPVPWNESTGPESVFHRLHEMLHGYRRQDPIVIQDILLEAEGAAPPRFSIEKDVEASRIRDLSDDIAYPVYDWGEIAGPVPGPAVILASDTTVFVAENWTAISVRGLWGNDLRLERIDS
ncbi:MAG: hydantoinase/oxoprolinase family protein [Candidatus Hydrogenedentota bacterium]|nr:MAG: hydantoinase/oxoprolinase family protein [Candidatus Hydrogenedentota bacterium]